MFYLPQKFWAMGRQPYKVKGYNPKDIKALFSKDEKYKIGIRLYAVYQVSLGKPSREVAELYDTNFKQILNWVHRFEKEGVEGLRDKSGRGRKSKLTQEQKNQLHELVSQATPVDYGYNTETWTGPILIDWVKNITA